MDTIRADNFCTTSGLLTATGAETVHDTTVTIGFCVAGKALTKTAITDGTTPTTDYNTSAAFPPIVGGGSVAGAYGNGCIVVWALNASGTVKCMQGVQKALDADGNFINAPQFPAVPDDVTPFAYQVLKAKNTASATTVIFGTANWNATGFTNVVVNVFTLPKRPQVA